MRSDVRFRLRLPLAGLILMLFLPPLLALSGGKDAYSQFAGMYRSDPAKVSPFMSVSLGKDGTATVTEDAGKGITILFGQWVDTGGQITVAFDPVTGEAAEPSMVFEPGHDELQAVTWNHAVWGNVTPPPMKKGFRVKQKYWFTPVR